MSARGTALLLAVLAALGLYLLLEYRRPAALAPEAESAPPLLGAPAATVVRIEVDDAEGRLDGRRRPPVAGECARRAARGARHARARHGRRPGARESGRLRPRPRRPAAHAQRRRRPGAARARAGRAQPCVDRALRPPRRRAARAARRRDPPLGAREAQGERPGELIALANRTRTGEQRGSPESLPEAGMRAVWRRAALVTATMTLLGAAIASAAGDEPWILDANNWQEGKGLLPDPVLKRLEKGEYWFKVVPVDPAKFRQNFAKKFWDAT